MIISEIKVGDRCWFPGTVHPREDGTNATVKNTISTTPKPGIQTITITTDDNAVWIAIPGLNVFWSRPKDEHMPKVKPRIKKTGWLNIYKNPVDGPYLGGAIHETKEIAISKVTGNTVDTIEITWTELAP